MSSTSSETSAEVEKSGRFVHVDPKPGTILVNVGYLLMRWSNGRWKNTVHRVSEPPRWKEQNSQYSKFNETSEGDQKSVEMVPERYSTAFFSTPDPTTIIEALPYCVGDQTPRWKPLNAGEYLRRKGQ